MIAINNKRIFEVKVYNEGRSQDHKDFQKNTFIFDTFRNHMELIEEKEEYPKENGFQTITLSIDAVILSREEFNNLIKAAN